MFLQQHCFKQSLHQIMTLGSGMVSRRKHHNIYIYIIYIYIYICVWVGW